MLRFMQFSKLWEYQKLNVWPKREKDLKEEKSWWLISERAIEILLIDILSWFLISECSLNILHNVINRGIFFLSAELIFHKNLYKGRSVDWLVEWRKRKLFRSPALPGSQAEHSCKSGCLRGRRPKNCPFTPCSS